ncbi:MAG: response regulator transcription factor [Defluviitaleaceae bacterium]|nr:response regulator transcription factor [Defluviitaleaceae bacterium]
MKNLLIADDNQQIVAVLSDYAKKEGFNVVKAHDGEQALKMALSATFDMILLDVMMPKKDGFDVCREIRKFSTVPIIMVTARGEDFDKIMGLDIGADDYVVKPFAPSEVMARIRCILRRAANTVNTHIFTLGSLNINLTEYTVQIGEKRVSLTKKEVEILHLLASNENQVFSRNQLLDSVWGYDYFGDSRIVDSHIKRLRSKLEDVSPSDWAVSTVWGVGYKFELLKNGENGENGENGNHNE